MGIEKTIQDASKELSPNKAILLYLSVTIEGNRAPSLLAFLPESDRQEIEPFLTEILKHPFYDRRFPLLDEIHRLSQNQSNYGLDEMDGSWILHYIKNEKPAIIGLILKHLPADKVYQILKCMNPELRAQLPDSDSIDQVSEEIIQVVRERFEKTLVHLDSPSHPSLVPEFSNIRNLTNQNLLFLIQDLGLDLLALSFQGVSERSLVELVQNLEREDAEKLFEKFNIYGKSNRGDIKAAQLEILNLSLDFSNGSDLILEAGVQRLARALVMDDENLVIILQHKLPLKSGYQLRRYVDDQRNNKIPENMVIRLQDMIVNRLAQLPQKEHFEGARVQAPMRAAGGY